ncbi:MAG: DNA-methyltransferase [Chloroflexia bacterium]
MAAGTVDQLYAKSCERMDEVPDEAVDLVVTSPPYWNAIDYEQHVEDPTAWYRTRKGGPYEEYLDWLERCFREVWRVLKPGGFCAVVIGTVLFEGRHYPVPHHFTTLMTERLGFLFHDEITWHKVTGGVKRAGVTIQKPYPGYYYPNIMTESILIFRKPGPAVHQERGAPEKEAAAFEIDDLFKREIANNVWHIAPVPPNHLPHPCPFPEEIPYRLIRMFSYPGDIVLDPFVGIGTTAKVARALGRHYIGYDVQPAYIETARRRVTEPLHLRQQLVAVFEKVPVQDRDYRYGKAEHRQMPLWKMEETMAVYRTVERADYDQIRQRFRWLDEENRPMVSSLDLDGIVSAMLMQNLRGWKLVGFYDAQYLWVVDGVDLSQGAVVFLDHDIYRDEILSVGHHILQWDKNTPQQIPQASLNPNLLRGITAQEFGRKYPFATLHFLLACMSAWHPEWRKTYLRLPREFLPVLLNVDSSMQNAFTYLRNAREWLDWLGGSEEDSPLYPFCRLLLSSAPLRLIEWGIAMQSMVGAGSQYTKRRAQAQRLNPTAREDWEQLSQLIDWLALLTRPTPSSWSPLEVPNFPELAQQNRVQVIELQRKRDKATTGSVQAMLKQQPFSYAIISKGAGGLNYSLLP